MSTGQNDFYKKLTDSSYAGDQAGLYRDMALGKTGMGEQVRQLCGGCKVQPTDGLGAVARNSKVAYVVGSVPVLSQRAEFAEHSVTLGILQVVRQMNPRNWAAA